MADINAALDLVKAAKVGQRRAPGTLDMYEQKSKQIAAVLGTVELNSLTPDDVDAYIALRLEDVGRHTVHKELIVLRQAIKYAHRRGLIAKTDEQLLPVEFSHDYEPRKEFLPEALWSTLVAAFPSDRGAHIAFMLATGANMSEAERAIRSHVDLDEGMVYIDGTKRETRKRWVRITPVTKHLIDFVVQHASGKSAGEKLFRPWVNLDRDLGMRCKQLGLAHLSSNDLRRTFGSTMVQRGVPFEVVAKLMGHSDTTMVYKVYGQLQPAHIKSLVDQYF